MPNSSKICDQPAVGLITALPEEFNAMRMLLDDPVEEYVKHDPARYTLGTLPSVANAPPHTVALTLLAATALKAAADGCANMIRSYPSIEAIINAGTAAGVPQVTRPDQHVRLGDVVIAEELVDYDHVDNGPDGTRLRRGCPLPSARLMRCAGLLRADEQRGERPWEQWLKPALDGYARPSDHTDVVYDSAGYRLQHPPRKLSGHRRGQPKIHVGLIGSADRSLRNIGVRDEIATRYRLQAIEMEGVAIAISSALAGKEWFVVRGISDYGDSHRNGAWRGYASLVAAAYVRALLAACQPLDRTNEGLPSAQYRHGERLIG